MRSILPAQNPLRNPLRFKFQLDSRRMPHLYAWTSVPDSMTRAIAAASGQNPEVQIYSEGPGRASRWEAQLIGKPSGCRVYTREISLRVSGDVVLVARSITPAGSVVEPLLRGLGNKPLAELLFTDPHWQRHQAPLALAADAKARLPGRVCVWQYAGRRRGTLLVAEYFAPSLLALMPG